MTHEQYLYVIYRDLVEILRFYLMNGPLLSNADLVFLIYESYAIK